MTVIKIKNSNVSGRLPSSGDIEVSELALNIADKKLYSKDAAGAIFEIGVAGDIPSGIAPPNAGNNNGDLYFDTATARLLYWDGSGWQTVVKASGDNFTGDVTLGTDKITLDATAGSATFAGEVATEATFTAGTAGNGSIRVRTDSDIAAFWVGQGGNTLNDATAVIHGDGSANFSGSITATDTVAVASSFNADTFSNVNANGLICQNPVSNSSDIFFRGRTGSGDNKVDIYTDGSASFAAGATTITSNGALTVNRTAGTNDVIGGQLNGAVTSTIKADGSATFEGIVTGGAEAINSANDTVPYGGVFYSNNASNGPAATLWLQNGRGGNTGKLMYGATSFDTEAFSIYSNGTANFAGGVESTVQDSYSFLTNGGGFYANGSTGNSLYIKNGSTYPVGTWNNANNATLELGSGNSSIYTISLNGGNGSASFANSAAGVYTFIANKPAANSFCISGASVNNPNAPTWYVTPVGAATFTAVNGAAFSINLEADDDTKYTSTTEEYEEQVEDTPFIPAVDAVVGPRGNVIKEEVPAVEATFKTVTKTCEVKTYIGPVLNVKDELQSLRARATQQDETIRLMTVALKSLGIDTASFPAPADEEPKETSRKKK